MTMKQLEKILVKCKKNKSIGVIQPTIDPSTSLVIAITIHINSAIFNLKEDQHESLLSKVEACISRIERVQNKTKSMIVQ